MTVKTGDVSELDAITKVLQTYMNAAKNGKGGAAGKAGKPTA